MGRVATEDTSASLTQHHFGTKISGDDLSSLRVPRGEGKDQASQQISGRDGKAQSSQLVFETIRQELATDCSMLIGSMVEPLMAVFMQNVSQGKTYLADQRLCWRREGNSGKPILGFSLSSPNSWEPLVSTSVGSWVGAG